MVLPPPWVTGQMEAPAQTKDMGGWKALVYTPEQQERLGVNEFGSKVIKVAKETMTATNDALRFGIGDRVSCNMGSECWASGKVVALHYRENGWPAETTAPYQVKLDPAFGSALIYAPEDTLETIRVYTPEQQERLGCECHGAAGNSKAEVTRDDDGALRFGIGDRVSCNLGLRCWASGTVVALHYQEKNWPPNATAPYQVKLDPAFGRGHIYVPMDIPKIIRIYTPEQELAKVAKVCAPGNRPALPAITPSYAAALLKSKKLLSDMSKMYFRKYDVNKDGILKSEEIGVLCHDLHFGLGLNTDKDIVESMQPYEGQESGLKEEEFQAWFAKILQDTVKSQVSTVP